MADEETAIAPSEPAPAPTIAPQEQDEGPRVADEPVDPGIEQPTSEEAVTAPEDDFEEFEWDGKPIRGPKGLKDGVLRQADYTKKTQEVASKAKALESREAEINQRAEATEAELDARAGLRSITSEIERLKEYDYAAYQRHHREDPMAANELWTYKQDLASRKSEFDGVLSKAKEERTAKAQQEIAKRWQETGAYAKEKIPGWSQETAKKVLDYAEKEGVPADFLERNMSPTLMRIMHRAMIGEQTLNTPLAANPTPKPQPLRVVNGKSSPTNSGDLQSADMETYVALRKKGVGGKALS
jgi:hypothetical protein